MLCKKNTYSKKSKIVVTITGSSGWESIQKLKPVFIFGYPWYSSFKGCFHIKEKSDIIKAISEIYESKNLFTDNDIINYINSIQDKLFDAYIGPFFFVGDKQDYNTIIKKFSKNLNEFIKIESKSK